MNDSIRDMRSRLISDGVVTGPNVQLTPLTGGVSSEIYLVADGDRRFVVKRALEKLKVKDDWFADISRNESEVDFIQYVSKFAPDNVPQVIAEGEDYFAMEYLGDGFENWKQLLLAGDCRETHAQMAGSLLGRIHSISRGDAALAARFDNKQNFRELRIDPYLITTGERHPELGNLFEEEAERLGTVRECLVHGDFSPKNILVSGDRLVVLDCEVADFGDPVFDYCFLLNHLLLKALFKKSGDCKLRPLVEVFMDAYRNTAGSVEKQVRSFSLRGGHLLAMLLLARVDGKSPVEYLTTESAKESVRQFVYRSLKDAHPTIDELVEAWFSELGLK